MIASSEGMSLAQMSDKCGLSRAMFYRNVDDLRDGGFIDTTEGFKL
ncbi:MAG: hypothetical protein GQ477_04190, partial [Nanohaloarchaea archaeon]|nr:hypothetical protein [Candidatus Nanohaloarchaea archaeon]